MRLQFSETWILFLLLLGAMTPGVAQNADQMSYAPVASSKFVSLPVLPACATFAAQRGDPSKGAAVLLLKFKSGCVIPWHWHTANENLMMVSGRGKAEMKSGGSHMMSAGDYMYLPSKQGHQFTCMTTCLLFDQTDGPFDIHYLNAEGKEIPPEEALKPMAKPAAAKKP